MSNAPHSTLPDLLNVWSSRAVIALDAHYEAARLFSRRHYKIGVPSIILATVAGAGVIADLKQVFGGFSLLFGALSMFAAVLSSLQTFLNYSEKAAQHKNAGARYSAVAREIAQMLTLPPDALAQAQEQIIALRQRLDALAEEAPALPDQLWDKARLRHLQAAGEIERSGD